MRVICSRGFPGQMDRISVESEHLLGTFKASTTHISEVLFSLKIQCEKFLTFEIFISSPSNIKEEL